MELETLIQIARGLEYLDSRWEKKALLQTDEIGKMLSGLSRSLNPQS